MNVRSSLRRTAAVMARALSLTGGAVLSLTGVAVLSLTGVAVLSLTGVAVLSLTGVAAVAAPAGATEPVPPPTGTATPVPPPTGTATPVPPPTAHRNDRRPGRCPLRPHRGKRLRPPAMPGRRRCMRAGAGGQVHPSARRPARPGAGRGGAGRRSAALRRRAGHPGLLPPAGRPGRGAVRPPDADHRRPAAGDRPVRQCAGVPDAGRPVLRQQRGYHRGRPGLRRPPARQRGRPGCPLGRSAGYPRGRDAGVRATGGPTGRDRRERLRRGDRDGGRGRHAGHRRGGLRHREADAHGGRRTVGDRDLRAGHVDVRAGVLSRLGLPPATVALAQTSCGSPGGGGSNGDGSTGGSTGGGGAGGDDGVCR